MEKAAGIAGQYIKDNADGADAWGCGYIRAAKNITTAIQEAVSHE